MKQTLLKPFVELVIVWKRLNDFQRARWKLTGLYVTILFVILNIFTGSLFFILKKEEIKHLSQVEAQWEEQKIIFPNRDITIIKLSKSPEKFGKDQLIALQHTFRKIIEQWILIIESVLMILAGVLSYFLSDRTLRPIQKKDEQQKQFLADVSHELKNPLTALKITLDVAKSQTTWKKGEIQETFLDIESEISRLTQMTEDLLILEKSDKSETLKSQKVAFIIRGIIEKCTHLAKNKNIEISSTLSSFSSIFIKEDLEKVTFNLLHNAIKFSHPNSKIKIILDSKGKLTIQDFGIGIAKNDLSKIFDRFYKSDNARTLSDENGSGLGLSIVKKICNKNRWRILLESRQGKGTKISITLT